MYGQTSFNYNQTFNELWDVSAMVGGAVKQTTYDNQRQYIKETFAIENWFSMNNTTLETGPMTSRERGDDLLLSVFASAQLAYANQIYLEIQARNDWSSILPPTNNHYFYPGASLSWIFTEAFEIPKMNFGKVRVSWADVGRPGPRYYGNVAFKVENYGGLPTMQLNDDDGSIYLPPADFAADGAGFPSPNLKPERKREYEVGFETAFFRGNRLSLDFSFFHNNTYNQIIQLPVPSSSGVKAVRMNAGDIAQNGIELSINTKPIMTKDWTWELGFNLANYTTKVVKLGKGITQQTLSGGKGNNVAIYATEGGQFGEFMCVLIKLMKMVKEL
ncbi:MAG: TonB-dependent receptor [Tannerellaceae bacterium]|nr:TonB-dependent receptor [Tannerellaceae bacterium]MCD8264441.1 TonB-dependent receptor [Tannerellaceae bacterium]